MDYTSLRWLSESILVLHNQDLTQKIEIFVIAWFFIRRTISGHFAKIETALGNVADQVEKLGLSLQRLESDHSTRLLILEKRVTNVENKN
jgi:hypothetical protein